MVRMTLVVAALLLTMQPVTAVAAEKPGLEPEKALKSDKARQVVVLLGALGVNSTDAKALIADIDSRVDGGKLNITNDRIGSGTLKFHYLLGNGLDADNFELEYTPDNSNWRGVAHRDSVMVQYQYKF